MYHDITNQQQWIEAQKSGTLRSKIMEMGGSGLIHMHSNLTKTLKTIYPDVVWEKLPKPRHFWSNMHNQRQFFDDIAKKLGKIDNNECEVVVKNHE